MTLGQLCLTYFLIIKRIIGSNLKKTVSIIYSFRNEAGNLEELINRSVATLNNCDIQYEIIFINDNSSDGSEKIILEHHKKNSRIKLINTSARYGQSQCTLAGIEYASGDAIIYLDSDLQDPPELFKDLISKWKEGYDVVHTKRIKRRGENPFKMMLTSLAYRFINKISEIDIPIDCGDYKLIDKKVAIKLNTEEEEPYLRGLVSWIGFKQATITYERDPRFNGETHFPFWGLNPIETFFIGLTSFSIFPLYISIFFTFISVIAFLVLIALVVTQGTSNLYIILLFMQFWITLTLTSISILSIYIARVHKQTRNRKMYHLSETIGFNDV